MQNHIIILGIAELLTFVAVLYLIIRADIFVKTLQTEVNDLHLYLPGILRDIRYDFRNLNYELKNQFFSTPVSPQRAGMIVGKMFSEIIFFRLKSLKVTKKFILLPMLLKAVNINQIFKPAFSSKK